MTSIAMDAARLIDMLPDEDKELAYTFVKKLVLAWDPDFTKLTPQEKMDLEEAENGEFIDDKDIDWDNIGH